MQNLDYMSVVERHTKVIKKFHFCSESFIKTHTKVKHFVPFSSKHTSNTFKINFPVYFGKRFRVELEKILSWPLFDYHTVTPSRLSLQRWYQKCFAERVTKQRWETSCGALYFLFSVIQRITSFEENKIKSLHGTDFLQNLNLRLSTCRIDGSHVTSRA